MAKTNWQDPKSGEIISPHISGLQEAVGKLEESLGISSTAETGIALSEVYISESDRYRIYQAPEGKRNWLSSPTPIIKKNGVQITTGFIIEYGGGAIVFTTPLLSTDIVTADATYTVKEATSLVAQINDLATYKGFLSAPSTVVSLANNVLTTINFGTPLYDTGFYSSGNPSRITIPANIKKVKVKGIASFASSANGHRLLLIRKNGVAQSGEAQVILPATSDGTIFVYTESAVLNVVQGDYFEFRVRQTSGGALDLNTASWFALEVVE